MSFDPGLTMTPFSASQPASQPASFFGAVLLTVAALMPVAHAQSSATGRPDATHVQMVSVPETYCRSIDNTDRTGQDYYFSAADVTAKSGKVIQSHNGGSCCTAAAPWNGTACQAVPTCTNDKDLVGWSCVATADSCARVGMTLINGACGVATPPDPCPYINNVGKKTVDIFGAYYRLINATTISYQQSNFCQFGGSCVAAKVYEYTIDPATRSFVHFEPNYAAQNPRSHPPTVRYLSCTGVSMTSGLNAGTYFTWVN